MLNKPFAFLFASLLTVLSFTAVAQESQQPATPAALTPEETADYCVALQAAYNQKIIVLKSVVTLKTDAKSGAIYQVPVALDQIALDPTWKLYVEAAKAAKQLMKENKCAENEQAKQSIVDADADVYHRVFDNRDDGVMPTAVLEEFEKP